MDYETMTLLAEADRAVSNALNDSAMLWVGAVLLIVALTAWFSYVLGRWSWVPRKQQRQRVAERF